MMTTTADPMPWIMTGRYVYRCRFSGCGRRFIGTAAEFAAAAVGCHGSWTRKEIVGSTESKRDCDSRCTGAKGPSCDCKCQGANHGSSYQGG